MYRQVLAVSLWLSVVGPAWAETPGDVLRTYQKQALFLKSEFGAVRKYGAFLQAFINSEYSLEDQRSDAELVKEFGYEGRSWWSYKADQKRYFWQDLNADGIDDVILLFEHSGWCGTVGCPAYVFFAEGQTLRPVGQMAIDLGSVSVGKPLNAHVKSIYAKDECLFWAGDRYKHVYAGDELLDGDEDWNPHACGGHYNARKLKFYKDCLTCHGGKSLNVVTQSQPLPPHP